MNDATNNRPEFGVHEIWRAFDAMRSKFPTAWHAALIAVWIGSAWVILPFAIDAAQSKSPGRVLQPARPKPLGQPAQSDPYDIAFKQFKLNNGLRVILAEDHRAPTFSICVTYNVGSRDENRAGPASLICSSICCFRALKTWARANILF
jgi:hypothetical protein